MPTYEFRCQNCNKEFIVTLSLREREAGEVTCPDCGGKELESLLSSFYARTSKKS
ncbi:MAG: zinc ribbon domain-containing protein [candidate division NC10 bacterium]|nr:zinc ribbon domain-containing protein [candidate division NC10 bacterium]